MFKNGACWSITDHAHRHERGGCSKGHRSAHLLHDDQRCAGTRAHRRRRGGRRGSARSDAATTRQASYLEDIDNWISLDEACAIAGGRGGADRRSDVRAAGRRADAAPARRARRSRPCCARSAHRRRCCRPSRRRRRSSARSRSLRRSKSVPDTPSSGRWRATASRAALSLRLDGRDARERTDPVRASPRACEETECQARGGAQCLYTVSWDAELAAAAADPQQRVTALEAQLAAMSERLRSAYATASDLVSTENLDTVLHRIVERAANAVRAPSFVLAVCPEPGVRVCRYTLTASRIARRRRSRAQYAGAHRPAPATQPWSST